MNGLSGWKKDGWSPDDKIALTVSKGISSFGTKNN